MLTEEDKQEIGRIARENIRLGMFFNDLREDLTELFNKYSDDDKTKYYSWSILAHNYFVEVGSSDMMEDLVEIVDTKHKVDNDMWKDLEIDFIEKYKL